MKILSFGSLNLDQVYQVPHFLRPGETLAASRKDTFCGGKGLNQSIAMARAGVPVYHAGAVGALDGGILLSALTDSGVDCTYVQQLDCPTGHAIIQVDENGQNCILLFGGANQCITEQQVDETLACFEPGDILVLQNEISCLPYLMRAAGEKGMTIVFNPSPMTPELLTLPLEYVSYFLLNEVEARDLCGQTLQEEDYPRLLLEKFPNSRVVLTLGSKGCIYQDASQTIAVPAKKVTSVDTTAAGDTFTGFFIAAIASNTPVAQALEEATRASAIAVTRPGASPSIPTREEMLQAKL